MKDVKEKPTTSRVLTIPPIVYLLLALPLLPDLLGHISTIPTNTVTVWSTEQFALEELNGGETLTFDPALKKTSNNLDQSNRERMGIVASTSSKDEKNESEDFHPRLDKEELNKVVYAYCLNYGGKRGTIVVFDEKEERLFLESLLPKLVESGGLKKVSGCTAINPSKACRFKRNGKNFVRTPLNTFRVTGTYWNLNLKALIKPCPLDSIQLN